MKHFSTYLTLGSFHFFSSRPNYTAPQQVIKITDDWLKENLGFVFDSFTGISSGRHDATIRGTTLSIVARTTFTFNGSVQFEKSMSEALDAAFNTLDFGSLVDEISAVGGAFATVDKVDYGF